MMDKDNQRRRQRIAMLPHGRLPNWVLVALAGSFLLAALIARSLG